MSKYQAYCTISQATANGTRKFTCTNTAGEAILWHDRSAPEGYHLGIVPTNVDELFAKLKLYIERDDAKQNDIEHFAALLNGNFFYKSDLSLREASHDARDDTEEEKQPSIIQPGELFEPYDIVKPYPVRPMLEALFVEKIAYFQELITLLLQKNDERFYKAFVEGMKQVPDFQSKENPWHGWNSDDMIDKIKELRHYAREITPRTRSHDVEADDRADALIKLAKKLEKIVDERNDLRESKDNQHAAWLNNFKAKVEIARALHKVQDDPQFAKHRDNVSRIAGEVLVAVLTLGMANLFKWAATDTPWFFSKTTSQQKIATLGVEMAGEVDREVKPEEKAAPESKGNRP